jgi:hypothetical protein
LYQPPSQSSHLPPSFRFLKGVGFFSRGWHGGRDARVPSVARAGSASVSLAWQQKCPARQRREQARPQKTYPLKPCGRARVLKSQVLPTPSSAHTPSHHAPSRSSPPTSDAPPHTTPPSSPSHNPTTPHTPHANAHRALLPPPPPDTTTDAPDHDPHQSAHIHASDRSPDAQAPNPPTPQSPCATLDPTRAAPLTAQTPQPNRRRPPSAAAPPSAPGGEDNTARFEKGVIGCACFSDFGGAISIKTAP